MRKVRLSAVAAAAIAGIVTLLPAVPATAVGSKSLRTPPIAHGSYADITVPRATSTEAEDLTDAGQVIGCFERGGHEHGFSLQHGAFTVLTHRSVGRASAQTCAFGVSSTGAIVGMFANKTGPMRGFVYRHGTFRTIAAPRAGRATEDGTAAIDINKNGVIVGWYITAKHVQHGFILRGFKFRTVDAPGAAESAGGGTGLTGIADNGTISGTYRTRDGLSHGFWLRHGAFHHIKVPGGRNTVVDCISDRNGLLVGTYRVAGRRKVFGFSEHHRVFRTLRDPSAIRGTAPQCGSDTGQVVGFYFGSAGPSVGFEFTPGTASPAITAPLGGPMASPATSRFLPTKTGLRPAK